MANKFQLKRTTVSGRTANTTNAANAAFIDKGELAVNLADRKIFSSDSSNAIFEVGSNLASLQVTTVVANGSSGTAGQVLSSNGTAVYWSSAAGGGSGTVTNIATANGLSGGPITSTGTIGVTSGSTLTVNAAGIHVNSALAITSLAASSNVQVGTVGAGNGAFVSNSLIFVGNNTVYSNITPTGIFTSTGTFAGAVSGITTLAAGNTTITGFANVTSTIQGGSSLTIAGAASGITTLAAGNTTITGFTNISGAANVAGDLIVTSETIGVRTRFLSGKASPAHTAGPLYIQYNSNDPVYISGGTGTSGLNITGYANVTTTLAAGNTTITGFVNVVSDSAQLRIGNTTNFFIGNTSGIFPASNNEGKSFGATTRRWDINAGTITMAGSLSGVTTLAAGNTTITGFANVTSTIQGGSSLTIAGAASGITTLAAGNTTITGFANVSTSVNSALLTVGTSFIANTTGAYHTGTVNAASHTVGTSFIANTTGAYHTGTVNAASHTVGTSFIANTTGTTTNVASWGATFRASNSTNFSGIRWDDTGGTIRAGLYRYDQNDLAISIYYSNGTFQEAPVVISATTGTVTLSRLATTNGTFSGAVSGITTLAAGNTSITGFANVSTSVNSAALTVGTSFIANTSRVVIGTAVGLEANGGIGTAGQVLHSNGTTAYWAADDDTNTTYDLLAVANTAANAGLLRLKDSSNANDTVTFTGTGTSTVSSNATHVIINSADQYVGTVTSVATANGLSGGTITSTGTLGVTTGSTLTVNTAGIHVNSALQLASLSLTGDLTVSGNLTVSGTRTYVNTTTLDVGDNIITLNADLGAVAPSQNAGLEIMRGTSANVQFLWDETNDRWSTNSQPLAVSSLVAAGAASGITTLAAGNTTITGFANISGNVQISAINATSFGATLTSNSTTAILTVGNSSVTATMNSSTFSGTANNSTNFGGSSLATVQGQITGNAATAYTNATIFAANASNANNGTLAFARLPSLFVGTTTIQSTSAAQAVSGITTLATGNTTITGFANVTSTLQVGGVATFGAANANFDSGVLFVDATNNRVGVNTTTPGSALDVRGVITGGDGTIQTVVSYTASAGVTGTLTNHPYVFYANNAERMRIAANGFVGIGTTTPGTSLEVTGGIRARGGAPGAGGVNNNGYAFSGSGDTDAGMYSSADGQIEFYTDSTEKMRIVSNGNIGIGTTTPGVYKLNVNGQSYFADTINLGSGGIISWTSGYSDGTTQTFQSPTSGSLALIANGNASLFIKSNQNVGIGTTTPGYKLEVNGSFAATTKSFVIPHPTKPDMKLRYGSLEGPENGVYVRGRLRAGETIIQLPDYWEGLVDQDTYTVNLTPVGKHQELFVEHIADDYIIVGGEDIDCFYTVYAERKDVEKLVVEF